MSGFQSILEFFDSYLNQQSIFLSCSWARAFSLRSTLVFPKFDIFVTRGGWFEVSTTIVTQRVTRRTSKRYRQRFQERLARGISAE